MTPPAPARTIFTTLLGVMVSVAGGFGSLFSAFALLLASGKPYANSVSDPLGIFLIFIVPPVTLLAGIGLLLRHRWARWWTILLTLGIIAFAVQGLVAPDIANPAYAPKPGPAVEAAKRAVFTSSAASITLGGLVLLGLFVTRVRREFAAAGKSHSPAPAHDHRGGWRVGHCGRDMMYYEENHHGEWQRISLDGELLTGRAHHVIYFASAETWQRYPGWARHRRDEIMVRIKSSFREPDYQYADGGTASMPTASSIPAVAPHLPSNDGTILPMLAFLVLITVACFWFTARGLERGEVRLPLKNNPAGNLVSRAEKPSLFWTCLGTLFLLATASTGFAAGLVYHRIRR